MFLRITEIGDISQKHRHNAGASDVLIYVQSPKIFRTGVDVLESHLLSLKQTGFLKWTLGTDTEIFKDNLLKYVNNLNKKDLVLNVTGNNQDDFGQSENSLYSQIENFVDDFLSVLPEDLNIKLICGGQHGPEIMSGRILYRKGKLVEVYTTYKYRVRLNDVEYESSAKKMEEYIKS